MTYRSHVAAPSRVFDHLYDPIFTTSDPKNVYKEDCIALTRSAPIHVYPVYNSMFSELSYDERNCYAYQKNVLPIHPTSTSIATSTNNNMAGDEVKRKIVSVTGKDRQKFFTNPISNIRTLNVGLMPTKNANDEHDDDDDLKVKYRTTEVQTLYR
jgi:hypothetical protein